MNRHLHALMTPRGQIMYTHHSATRLEDGATGFVSDGYLVASDGVNARALDLDELLDIISTCGTGKMIGLAHEAR